MSYALWSVYDHYLFAGLAVLGTATAVGVVQWWVTSRRGAAWAHSLHGVVPPFINIIGVLFGLTLAFLANDTWSAHDRATHAVFREADALRSLVTLSGPVAEPLRSQFRNAIGSYGRASAAEWPQLAQRRPSAQVAEKADALLTLIASPAMAAQASTNVQALMLAKASDISNERDQRISLAQTHVNPLKWLGMAFLGLITLLSVAVVHVDNPRATLAAMVLFALAAAPTAAIVLVQGNPFQEPAAVSAAPLIEAISGL
jgi:hypothetical protein